MTESDFYWYWLANISGIGVRTQKKLLDYFAHPSVIYDASEKEIKNILSKKQCEAFFMSKNEKIINNSASKLLLSLIHI